MTYCRCVLQFVVFGVILILLIVIVRMIVMCFGFLSLSTRAIKQLLVVSLSYLSFVFHYSFCVFQFLLARDVCTSVLFQV